MVINGQWQGPPAPAYPVPDQYRPPNSQRSMPLLRQAGDAPRQTPSALRPRAPSSPVRQFFPVFPPRTTSSNTRRVNGPAPDIGGKMAVPPPPPRNASLPHPNNFLPPPRKSSAAVEQPMGLALPPRTSSKPVGQPFAIAGTTPPPHLPLRQQASQNLRFGRSNSQNRLPDVGAGKDFPMSDRAQRLRPRSAEFSPASSPAQSPRLDVFAPATASSASSFLGPPSSGFGPPPQTYGPPHGYASTTTSQISLASAPAARPPPAHQGYNVGSAFRSTSTPQLLTDGQPERHDAHAPGTKSSQRSRKNTEPWQDQAANISLRESLHSALTTSSSAVDHSGTERSSVVTSRSSSSEVNQQSSNWPKIREENAEVEEVISVDDYLDMYANGFDTSPAVTATDGDIPGVPSLPPLQKDAGYPFPIIPPDKLEQPASEEYPEAESPPPITVEPFRGNTNDPNPAQVERPTSGISSGPGPVFAFHAPSEAPAATTQSQNNLLSVTATLPAMRRVESLMPEPPPDDPPTPEPPQDDHPVAERSYFDTPRAVSPLSVVHHETSLASDQRTASIQSVSARTASLNSEIVSMGDHDSDSGQLHSRIESLKSASTRPVSIMSLSSELEPSQEASRIPEATQEKLSFGNAPRLSSYAVESPYSNDPPQEAVYETQSGYSSLAPPSVLPRPESSYDEPPAKQSTTPEPEQEARPLTAPAPADSPSHKPSLPQVPVPNRPQTAPRLHSIDEQSPMPPPIPEPYSAQSSPIQSPTSARFPSGSQASPLGSPVLKKNQLDGHAFRPESQASFASSFPFKAKQPERGSIRPAPRARMMAPPMKVGAIGPGGVPRPFAAGARTSAQIMAGIFDAADLAASGEEEVQSPHRDRYGFKKQSQYVQEEQYDAWNLYYAMYLERRRNKWNELMMSNGCSIDKPTVFPPKSDKIKRYVRKGIPPEWRGAAWFYYAGGPERLAENPQLYVGLATRGDRGDMSEQDREHIERDLNRTFPDNVKFKADPEPDTEKRSTMTNLRPANNRATMSTSSTGSRDSTQEQPMIRSLRRVLRAFAIHCPKIGYCQSLNFLAGQLLLFLDGDEEKAFHLLCILTTEHLPGTHGFALEGANVDIGVLMQSLRDTMPAVWAKLDDRAGSTAKTGLGDMRTQTGLPTVSLATTAWFMSCFVGTLPVESACRVWDCLFYEGSKTLFRVALGIFRLGEPEIRRLNDPMEIFQVVQTLPRHLIDANALMEASFGKSLERRGLLSQGVVERRRIERRNVYNAETIASLQPAGAPGSGAGEGEKEKKGLSRGLGTLKRLKSRKGRS